MPFHRQQQPSTRMDNYHAPKAAGIKAWAEEDRPREKLMTRGRQHLSNAELIAILLGSGSREESAVSLAQRLLDSVGNNLYDLGRLSRTELMHFKGIGEAKAISIEAAMELGRRRQASEPGEKPHIRSSHDAFAALGPLLMDLPHEEFWVAYLNRGNRILTRERISQGGVAGTVADGKLIFRRAIELVASSIVLFHNHPSGNLQPSAADIKLTQNLKATGQLLDIPVLDHLIVAGARYYSFADEGQM